MVEWKKLGEVSNLVRGKVISKDYIRQFGGEYPVYSSQTANNGILGCINSYMFNGDYLTWTTDGAYAGTIFRRNGKFNITNVCGLIDITNEKVNQDFLYYWLSKVAKNYVMEGMGNPKLMSNVASTIQIPIPSLSEQNRIVGILDTFTDSIENLKQQIAQRRKQFEFYRDQLLDLEGKEGVKMKKLGEICLKTLNIKWKNEDINSTYSYVDLSSVDIETHIILSFNYINKNNAPSRAQQIVKFGDVLLGTTRPTLKRFTEIPFSLDNQICSTGFCVFRANTDKVLSRWIFHNIGKSKFWKYCEVNQQGAGYPCLSNADAFNFSIPLPPLSEQQRIVSILDTFEASISNLEAQLAQRQKQYEYYRNKLLSFGNGDGES